MASDNILNYKAFDRLIDSVITRQQLVLQHEFLRESRKIIRYYFGTKTI